jgi:hypothetical protein
MMERIDENLEIVGLCGMTIENCHYSPIDDLCNVCPFAPEEDGEEDEDG